MKASLQKIPMILYTKLRKSVYWYANIYLESDSKFLAALADQVLSNFLPDFDAEWLVISGEFLQKGAEIRPVKAVRTFKSGS